MSEEPPESMPERSERIFRFFRHYNNWYLGRSFHTLRILQGHEPPEDHQPSIFYLNHPGWWDPLVCIKLIDLFWPDGAHYAPIEQKQLQDYWIFNYLGFIGVQPGSPASTRAFLRVADRLLDQESSSIWMTPQGGFADPADRPLNFMNGLGHLAAHRDSDTCVPVAIHYSFWEQPKPEILTAFGRPIPLDQEGLDRTEWTSLLEDRLESVLDPLLDANRERRKDRFRILYRGSSIFTETWRYFCSSSLLS